MEGGGRGREKPTETVARQASVFLALHSPFFLDKCHVTDPSPFHASGSSIKLKFSLVIITTKNQFYRMQASCKENNFFLLQFTLYPNSLVYFELNTNKRNK